MTTIHQTDAAAAQEAQSARIAVPLPMVEAAKAGGKYRMRQWEAKDLGAYLTIKAEIEAFTQAGEVLKAAQAAVALKQQMELVRDEPFHLNLVVTVGKDDALDKYFAGSAYTAAWYLGLVDGGTAPTYAATDTLASHAGWTENSGYTTPAARGTASWAAASGGSKALASAISYSGWTAAATIAGAFMCTASSGTTGILYSAGSFTGGNASVGSGTTLQVSWTGSL